MLVMRWGVLSWLLLYEDCVAIKPKAIEMMANSFVRLGKPLGRIVIELRMDVTPATAENVS